MTTKEGRLSLRISSEDKKLIQKRAIDLDMKISEYVMYLVNNDLKIKKEALKMECSCKVCNGLFKTNEIYIIENGEYVCEKCQQQHNFKLADIELLKRIGSHDCRN